MARILRSDSPFPLTPAALMAALPVLAGALAALVVAAVVLLMADWRLAGLVEASGISLLLPMAQPPLGWTARGLLAVVTGGLTGAVVWSALFLLVGQDGVFAPRRASAMGVPVVRRADAHPDAPPRRPLSAAELGTPAAPPAPPPDIRDLPADLEQPLAAFDPAAIPAIPREPVRAVRSVAPLPPQMSAITVEPVDTPRPLPMTNRADARGEPRPIASIETLLDRLERGVRRSVAP